MRAIKEWIEKHSARTELAKSNDIDYDPVLYLAQAIQADFEALAKSLEIHASHPIEVNPRSLEDFDKLVEKLKDA